MTKRILAGLVFGLWLGVTATSALADDASGQVTDTGFGTFKLDESGTTRQFNLSSSKTQYEPATWRPTVQDKIKVVFTVNQGKKEAVLAVDKVTLVKAGPNTIGSLTSPATVEITEVGKSGIKAKLSSGQVVKFSNRRGMERSPAGWVPAVGEKAKIEFRPQPTMVFTVSFVMDKMEKVQ
jgi:hypothetical protein